MTTDLQQLRIEQLEQELKFAKELLAMTRDEKMEALLRRIHDLESRQYSQAWPTEGSDPGGSF